MYTKYKYTYMNTILSTIEMMLLYHTIIIVYEYNFEYNFEYDFYILIS